MAEKKEVKEMKKIAIDEATQKDLNELRRAQREIQNQIQSICRTYQRAKGGEGQYALSDDNKALVLQDPKKPLKSVPGA